MKTNLKKLFLHAALVPLLAIANPAIADDDDKATATATDTALPGSSKGLTPFPLLRGGSKFSEEGCYFLPHGSFILDLKSKGGYGIFSLELKGNTKSYYKKLLNMRTNKGGNWWFADVDIDGKEMTIGFDVVKGKSVRRVIYGWDHGDHGWFYDCTEADYYSRAVKKKKNNKKSSAPKAD